MTSDTTRGYLPLLLVAWMIAAGCQGDLGTLAQPAAPSTDESSETYDIGGDDVTNPGHSLYFYYGPMKSMIAEAILYSIQSLTGHSFGSWEYTTPDPASKAFVGAGNGDGTFYRHCRLLGGCMEHRIPQPRTSFVGTAYVLELEKAVTLACGDRETFGMFPDNQAPGPSTTPADIITYQYRKAMGAPPDAVEMKLATAYFVEHLADPEHEDVSPLESAGRGHCRAILGTNKFLFY